MKRCTHARGSIGTVVSNLLARKVLVRVVVAWVVAVGRIQIELVDDAYVRRVALVDPHAHVTATQRVAARRESGLVAAGGGCTAAAPSRQCKAR